MSVDSGFFSDTITIHRDTTEVTVLQEELSGPFPDVSSSHEAHDAISYLVSRDVLSGYEDGLFRPDRPISRAEVLAVTFGALDIVSEHASDFDFRDVGASHWVRPLLGHAVHVGAINDGRTYFEPNRAISQAEILAILFTLDDTSVRRYEVGTFTDISGDEWYANYAQTAREYRLINRAGIFAPNRYMTRAEVAETLYTYILSDAHDKK